MGLEDSRWMAENILQEFRAQSLRRMYRFVTCQHGLIRPYNPLTNPFKGLLKGF